MEENMELSESESHSEEEISKLSQKILSDIKTLEKELGCIQEECRHIKYTVKNSEDIHNKTFELKRVCDCCHADLGHPSPDETTKWINS